MSRLSGRYVYPEIEEYYALHETLGSGGFAKVKAAIHRLTGEKVAIKIMDKEQLGKDLPRVYREIEALKRLHHQHVCQMFQIIETDRMIHLVLEFCSGGELFDYIVAKEKLSEKESRSFFRQIVSALHYCHTSGIIHRDLKPENLLLDEDSNIKLIDFGLVAEPDTNKEMLETCCGSPAYAAPELIKGGPYIGPQADVWSLGVLLYALLNGFLPFDDDNTVRLYALIQRGEYEIPEWLSRGSINLLDKLLNVSPHKRASVKSLLNCQWVMKGYNNKSIDWTSVIQMDNLDMDCVSVMSDYYQKDIDSMREDILEWEYGNITATYLLLLQKKLNGGTPEIIVKNQHSDPFIPSRIQCHSPLLNSPTPAFPIVPVNSEEITSTPSEEAILSVSPDKSQDIQSAPASSPAPKPKSRRISLGLQIHPPRGEVVNVQRPKHPAISMIKDEALEDILQASLPPVPIPSTPQPPRRHTEVYHTVSIPTSHTMDNFREVDMRPIKKTLSYESQLHNAVEKKDATSSVVAAQGGPRRKRLGSLEHIFKKAKKALTIRRGSSESGASGPRKIKGIYNNATTSRKSSDEVLFEIENVLSQMSVQYEKDGYLFHCSVPSYKESSSHKKDKIKTVKFDLEVCILPRLEMLGVRRKRIKGDVWEYKRICVQIFEATRL